MAKIRHIAVKVEDQEKTAEFYKQTFGMTEAWRGPVREDGRRAIYLTDGYINMAVLPARGGREGIDHFGFQVEDEWDAEEGDGEDDDIPGDGGKRRGEISRGAIRLKGALESGDQRKPYDPQVLVTNARAKKGTPGPQLPEARIGEDLLADLGFTTETVY